MKSIERERESNRVSAKGPIRGLRSKVREKRRENEREGVSELTRLRVGPASSFLKFVQAFEITSLASGVKTG